MKNKIIIVTFSIMLAAILTAACAPAAQTPGGQINVTVSILPEKYFVERIGGDHVKVNVMVGPGDSPHTYEPKTKQMASLSQSAIYFTIGVEFESAWMDRMKGANPTMKVVDLSANLEKIPMTAGIKGEEQKGEPDPHVWTSPENVKVMSKTIYDTLVSVDPTHQADYQANLNAFIKDIDQLENDIRTNLKGISSNKFIVFHPGWGYFARDFGLEQISIEIGGSEPSAQELSIIIDEAKANHIKVVFGAPEFSTKTAEYIAQEVNGKVLLIDNLAEDWLDNLRSVSNTFGEILKNQS